MIRFLPDTWSDALLRPVAMAAPDAGVYVEIMAPDARFAIIVVLVVVCILPAWRGKWHISPTVALLMFVSAAFAVWLTTSGNGRYFIPILLAAGPLCIALVYRWPSTKVFKGVIATVVVGVQAFIVHQNNPFHSWRLAPWTDAPFFEVTLDEEALSHAATYVTVTSISYSLIAPKFPAASRWVNISSQPHPVDSADGRRMQAVLAESKSLRLLIPTVSDHVTSMGYPSEQIVEVINGILAGQRLALQGPTECRLLPSKGLAGQAFRNVAATKPETLAKVGFWVCPLKYPVNLTRPITNDGGEKITKAFEAIEKVCPRLFPPGEALTARIDGGFVRGYSSADMKVYVLDSGEVFYKYWRALNPMLIGTVDVVLAEGYKMDCNSIRGRSGLPWDRRL